MSHIIYGIGQSVEVNYNTIINYRNDKLCAITDMWILYNPTHDRHLYILCQHTLVNCTSYHSTHIYSNSFISEILKKTSI